MEETKPQPYETYQELLRVLDKRKGVVENMDNVIPVSQAEMDMYKSYNWPDKVGENTPKEEAPEVITYLEDTLIVVSEEQLGEVKKEIENK